MLVELSVMEQRYQAVLAVVQDGWKVTEVADTVWTAIGLLVGGLIGYVAARVARRT